MPVRDWSIRIGNATATRHRGQKDTSAILDVCNSPSTHYVAPSIHVSEQQSVIVQLESLPPPAQQYSTTVLVDALIAITTYYALDWFQAILLLSNVIDGNPLPYPDPP